MMDTPTFRNWTLFFDHVISNSPKPHAQTVIVPLEQGLALPATYERKYQLQPQTLKIDEWSLSRTADEQQHNVHEVMKSYSGADDSPSDQHEEDPKVMLLRPNIPLHVSGNSSYNASYRSINGTRALASDGTLSPGGAAHVTTSPENNSTTIDYEQLSREFYKNYDYNIGVHTAAVLGGILIWIVIYVIYRTKVRKCVIRLFRKKCGAYDEEVESKKLSDSEEKESSSLVSPNMVRPFINPSIVIESTPPDSSQESSGTCNQYNKLCTDDSHGHYPLHGNNEDGYIFQFPCTGHHNNHNQYQHYHQQFCQEGADVHHQLYLQQLPKSEMDIPSATAQWVQNMPLVARSHQDFAGLLLAMQSRCMLAMNKPCSCPIVCPRLPQPLPLLDLPSTWNKSLPVLSNSMSSQLLSAYETAPVNGQKDIKDIINARRKEISKQKYKSGTSGHRDSIEYTKLEQQSLPTDYADSNIKQNVPQDGSSQSSNSKKKKNRTPPNLTIMIPDSKESMGLISHISHNRSPIPIPVTPTVMIQNSQQINRRQAGCDTNSSVTSSSSTDLLSSAMLNKSAIPAFHLLSPQYESRSRSRSNASQCSWSKEKREKTERRRSGSVSPHPYHWHRCSFSKQGRKNFGNDCQRHNSWTDSDGISVVSSNTLPHRYNKIASRSNHRRTLSDYNRYYADLMGNVRSSPQLAGHNHKRSRSADITYLMAQQREQISPTYSNGSNKNSLGTSSYSHSPSPHLLQVPDPNNLRPFTPDTNVSGYCQNPNPSGEQQTVPRQHVHSDSNIAYYCGCSGKTNNDNSMFRRHSAYVQPISGDVNLSLCVDNSVLATSSFGSASSQGSSGYSHQRTSSQHYRQPCHHRGHLRQDQSRHHSTGMLAHECASHQVSLCAPGAQSNMNRSYSAVIMETKL